MSEPKVLFPKFLTKLVAENAMDVASLSFQKLFPGSILAFHAVILVPTMNTREGPNYKIEPHALIERSCRTELWTEDFREIAQCKALQLWHGRNDGGTDIKPHLLFSGDTPFWGGVKRDGIVVACSGVEPWFDRMIASMTADVCIALAYNAWMRSSDKTDGVLCFLT